MSIEELIAEMERAREGAKALDQQIALVLGWTYHPENAQRTINWWIDADGNERLDFPAWTRSLDAAMTLVPEGCCPWSADFSVAGRFSWTLHLTGENYENWCRSLPTPSSDEDIPPCSWIGVGKTAPLALCIAALRARMAAAPTKEG